MGTSNQKSMEVERVLHMVGGAGVTSYAANSRLQEKAIFKTKTIVEEAIKEVFNTAQPKQLVVADLGCSSGPNTFLVMSHIINAVGDHCLRLGREPSEIQCFLNDLEGNDFNTMFQYSKMLKRKVEEEKERVPYYYVVGVPGTFYGRLFPSNSVHFIHSSYCLMWLSQVPQGLESDIGIPLNKGNIYISKTSPQSVIDSYLKQFENDFSKFLNLRFKELVFGGRMVLAFLGRQSLDAKCGQLSYLWGLLADALNAMALQGLVNEEEIDTFNLPFYAPTSEEVKEVIRDEASFSIDQTRTFVSNWDPFDDSCDDDEIEFDSLKSGENVANCIRAVTEPVLAKHFGDEIMDELFSRFANNVGNHLMKEKTKYVVFVITLKK